MISPKVSNRPKFYLRNVLAILGAAALWLWSLTVSLGTGIGYDHPVDNLFDGGILASLWRIAKAMFLGGMAWAVSHIILEHFGEAEEDPYGGSRR